MEAAKLATNAPPALLGCEARCAIRVGGWLGKKDRIPHYGCDAPPQAAVVGTQAIQLNSIFPAWEAGAQGTGPKVMSKVDPPAKNKAC